MNEYQGRFAKYNAGKPYAAAVKIKIKEKTDSTVEISCNGDGWVLQGYIESVSRNGYEDWKKSAIVGAEFALEKLEKTNLTVEITDITGMITDTSASAVGAATIYAVWKALDYTATDEEINYIESVVFSFDYDEIPVFKK